jgi:hypothetical protein
MEVLFWSHIGRYSRDAQLRKRPSVPYRGRSHRTNKKIYISIGRERRGTTTDSTDSLGGRIARGRDDVQTKAARIIINRLNVFTGLPLFISLYEYDNSLPVPVSIIIMLMGPSYQRVATKMLMIVAVLSKILKG